MAHWGACVLRLLCQGEILAEQSRAEDQTTHTSRLPKLLPERLHAFPTGLQRSSHLNPPLGAFEPALYSETMETRRDSLHTVVTTFILFCFISFSDPYNHQNLLIPKDLLTPLY